MTHTHSSGASVTQLQPVSLHDVSRDKSGQHDHIVQFYEGDDFLCERVASFLSDGVRQGEPIGIIATDDHRRIFSEQLQSSGIDVEAALRAGRLVILDARETLSRFMVEKMPDWNKFKATIGSTIEALAGGSGAARVRIYGEMVDVLWRDGNPQAAIHLEELWNDLGNSCSFSLLCAYRMGNFYKEADGAHFQHICRTHSLVVPSESYPQGDEDGARLREVSSLQQRAKSLEFEIAHRKELEVELRTALRDLRASEEALRRSEAELKDFFENAAEGLHWIGADGVVQWANKAELDMLGYSAEEYIGRPIAEFHADPEVIADMLARLARNETLHDYEVRLRCKDGSIRHVLINSNARWQDEKFLHSRCFSRDVTARKLAEAKLRAAEQERAQLLEREREARAEAEAASKAKDEFLAMLGHELRNPLSPIVTALQLMRLRGDLTASKERAVIERQVRHLVRLVDDLLDVSRITRGKIELHREHVEIADVVAKGVERSSPLLEQRKHHLVLDVPAGVLESDCERGQVHGARRPNHDFGGARRRQHLGARGRRRRGDRSPPDAADLRSLHPVRADAGPLPRRARPRADHRAQPGRAARREGDCSERGGGSRQRVHGGAAPSRTDGVRSRRIFCARGSRARAATRLARAARAGGRRQRGRGHAGEGVPAGIGI